MEGRFGLGQGEEEEELSSEQLDSEESSEEKLSKEDDRKKNVFNVCLINARSILLKLDSLVECLDEMQIDLCTITETWAEE